MKLATFNVENLFSRAKALNQDTWAEGKPILEAYARFNALIQNIVYSPQDKADILSLLTALGLAKTDENSFVILRRNRGKLLHRSAGSAAVVVANGRSDWIGWLELKKQAVSEVASLNTGRVIADLNADVVAVVEAEDRIALRRFCDDVLTNPTVGGRSYEHVMLIDGNDDRGIDVGLMTRATHPIVSMCSHVDAMNGKRRIFPRDCAEFVVKTPAGARVRLLVNHFKSKGFGSQASSNAKRLEQARKARAIYNARIADGEQFIAVLGDFNDTPPAPNANGPLSPLLGDGQLKDVSDHPNFQADAHPGTYKNGTKSNKIDYILLSPALFALVTGASYFRKGVWGNKNGDRWPHYPTMTRDSDAASDHAAVWVDLNV